jgi:murein L,D-transpeptidase YafK
MKYRECIIIFMVTSCLLPAIAFAQSFRSEQQKYPRVKEAYSEKHEMLKVELGSKGVNRDSFEIFIRSFKNEQLLEVWVRSKGSEKFQLFKTYNVCRSSGVAGPKCRQGDLQVPEGFYQVSVFNPVSSFHLSLGLNYPNVSDLRRNGNSNPGGDIMIHGNCVTIGCLPLTDELIKEVYILAVEARNAGQKSIPVHIFPARLDEKGMKSLNAFYSYNPALLSFWSNLQPGYLYFESNRKLPLVNVDAKGNYTFR